MASTSSSFITALGLVGDARDKGSLAPSALADLAAGRRSFDWLHLGLSDTPVGQVLDALTAHPQWRSPRTGHLGNWEDIARGRSGMIDYNKAICAERDLGYPLIYSFTQTETEDLTGGDWIYLPGSIVENGERQALDLYSWDGTQYAPRSRETAWLCPFMMTKVDGELVSLTELHLTRMRKLPGFDFQLTAQALLDHEDRLRDILVKLIEDARTRPNPERALVNVLGRVVGIDGSSERGAVSFDGQGYRVKDDFYGTTDALVEVALLPLIAAAQPQRFFADVGTHPLFFPLLSNNLITVLRALLDTHFPGGVAGRAGLGDPCNVHPEWGAVGMAGYPPRQRGHFAEKTKAKEARQLAERIAQHCPDLEPSLFVLLPASIFTICPSDAHPGDEAVVGRLLRSVLEGTNPKEPEPARLAEQVEALARQWWPRARTELSGYYLNRFGTRRSVLNDGELPEFSSTVEPDGFRELSMRQACMVVGALTEAVE